MIAIDTDLCDRVARSRALVDDQLATSELVADEVSESASATADWEPPHDG